jgi:hypothetical protein
MQSYKYLGGDCSGLPCCLSSSSSAGYVVCQSWVSPMGKPQTVTQCMSPCTLDNLAIDYADHRDADGVARAFTGPSDGVALHDNQCATSAQSITNLGCCRRRETATLECLCMLWKRELVCIERTSALWPFGAKIAMPGHQAHDDHGSMGAWEPEKCQASTGSHQVQQI